MTRRLTRWIPVFILLVSVPGQARAQQQDVTFFVIGKHANFNQLPHAELKPVDFSFFSEIFLTANGNAEAAFLETPGGERIRFRDQRQADGPEKDNLLLISGAKRFTNYAELQSWYPDGTYGIEFNTPGGPVKDAQLSFPNKSLPRPPQLTLRQDGAPVCGMVDPDRNLDVSWSKFVQGSADENGILDDLIFVILEDHTGMRVSHSGRPFENGRYLTFADTTYEIKAQAMQAGEQYTLSVEHASLNDTKMIDGVAAMTTSAVTTSLKFRTSITAAAECARNEAKEIESMRPTTDQQVVMFYYKNLDAAEHFYGDILGFDKTLDEDWVKFYRTSLNGTVGLVAEGEGAWHHVQAKNAVMLSIVTSELDAWYETLRHNKEVRFLKKITEGELVRSFLVEDPGGYTVEFFEWTG